MNQLYPLKFRPIFKEKVWGGQRIRTDLGLDFSPLPNCGEAWMLSGVPGSHTVVSNGFLKGNELNELVEIYMDDLVGEKAFNAFGDKFPVLVKFIDSNEWLSIQVHPDDRLAAKRKTGNGKTEMWYILDAAENARLISGFFREINRNQYQRYLEQNKLPEILNFEQVSRGDLFFLPAGRIHALGPGILLAEIQQTSDTTYRIYDWDRVGADGNPRELHTDLALEAIDFRVPESYRTTYRNADNTTVNLLSCPAFTTNLIRFDRSLEKDLAWLDSFLIFICTEGRCNLRSGSRNESLKKGELVVLPAVAEQVVLKPEPRCTLLEVFLP